MPPKHRGLFVAIKYTGDVYPYFYGITVAFRATPRLSFLVRQKREAKTDSSQQNKIGLSQK
jgi:hypothetical protein